VDRKILWIAPLVVLAIGILPIPYGYYFLSRAIVCGCSLFFVLTFYREQDTLFAWIFGLLSVLYNPIIPIHLGAKELWMVVNIMTALTFILKRKSIYKETQIK